MKVHLEFKSGETAIVEFLRSYFHHVHVIEVIWTDGQTRKINYEEELNKMIYLMG